MRTLIAAMLGIGFLCGASDKAPSGLAGTVDAPAKSVAASKSAPPPNKADLEKAELRGEVAQLMLVTLRGLYGPNMDDKNLLSQTPPGGVVIPLIVKPQDAADYISTLRAMPIESRAGYPLLIGANLYDLPRHERGVGASFAQLPSLMSISASGDIALTERLAKLTAEQLSIMGFNLNLGPALDLAPTLEGALGGVHYFGSNPNFASVAGGAIISTFGKNGVMAMPMGFPGGDCNRVGNSPATLLTPKALLKERDLLPYVKAIEHSTPLLHVGNALVPTIDSENRLASLSPEVMKSLLRDELKYQGVIVAGPIDSGDVKRLRDTSKAAIESLKAGADMLYWADPGPHVSKAVEAIARAVESGEMDKAVVSNALERVVKLKRDQGLITRELPDKGKAAGLASKKRYPEEAYEIERHSITLLQNRDNTLPLKKGVSTPVGVTGIVGVDVLHDLLVKPLKMVGMQPISTAKHIGDIEDFEITRLTQHGSGFRTAICIFTDMPKTQGQIRLVKEFKKAGVRVVVVYLGHPRSIPKLTDADAIVLAYCDPGMCESSLQAVADVLLGEGPVAVLPGVREMKMSVGKSEPFDATAVTKSPTGRLPISLGDAFQAGFSMSYDVTENLKNAEWDFGDGKRAKGVKVDHAYAKPGNYSVTLTVTGKHDDKSSGVFDVVVE